MRKIITITICALVLLHVIFCSKLSELPINEAKPFGNDIEELAENKLNDLISTNYWSHTNSDGCDFSCRTRVYMENYSWIGENLYKGTCFKERAFKEWEKSPSHKEVLDHEYNQEVLLMGEYKENACYIVLIRAVAD